MPTMRNLQFGTINFSNTGDNTIVAAVPGAFIKIWAIDFTVTTATNLTFKDGAGAVSGLFNLQANGSYFDKPPLTPAYIISPGNAFIINQSGTSSVQGTVAWSF